jgi:cytochrome c biogenesis protein CcmG, thiol:disulfide interchange protein DsbE
MRTFFNSHSTKLLFALGAIAVLIGISAATYLVGRYSVTGVPSFKRQYDLVLKKYDGSEVKLAAYKNKVLVVSAWASWCPYCKAEIENLSRLQESLGDSIQVVAVNRAEPLGDAKSFSDTLAVSSRVDFLLDANDAVYKEMGGYAMPETVFIDAYGHVLFHQRGPMSLDLMQEKISELVK